jgi:hypothetical protein
MPSRLHLWIDWLAGKGLPGLALVLLPGLLTLLFLRLTLGATPFDCCPAVNDEIAFWLEIATFREAGFNGGYHTSNEQMAQARFCHFDPRGPAYPVLYGFVARVLGWRYWSGPMFHLLFLAAATLTWLGACRPDRRQIAIGILLVGTFWPCLLLLPSTMQEGLHFAIAFLLAAEFELWMFRSKASFGGYVAVAATIALAALVRLTWAFVLLPWFVFAAHKLTIRGRLATGSAAVVLGFGLFLVTRWLNAPHASADGIGFVAWLFKQFETDPKQALALFCDHAAWNLGNFVLFRTGGALEMLQRYTLLALLVVIPVGLWRNRHGDAASEDARQRWAFAALNIAPLTAAVILIYDVGDWRDFRVLAPHLLLVLLVLARGVTGRWVVGLSCVYLLFTPAFLGEYAAVHRPRVHWDRNLVATFEKEIHEVVQFDPARPAWDNTILVTGNLVTYPLVAVPPGMGVNAILKWSSLDHAPRSRYLLMSEQDTRILARQMRLRPLARTRLGIVSLNVDSALRQDGSQRQGSPAP